MLRFHTNLLTQMLNHPEAVLNKDYSSMELVLVEENINSFGADEDIPPIASIHNTELLEDYYLYSTFLTLRQNVAQLAEDIQKVPEDKLFTFVSQLFGEREVQREIQIYLLPIGYPLGDAYVRQVDGQPVIFVNLTALQKYGQTSGERLKNLIPILEHEIFHFYFERLNDFSTYWQQYKENFTPVKEAQWWVLNEGIGHFIGCRERIDQYLQEKYDLLKAAYHTYLKVMDRLQQNNLHPDEIKDIMLKGIANSFFDKYLAIIGMLAVYIIYQKSGIDGVRSCLEDMQFFQEMGLEQVGVLLR